MSVPATMVVEGKPLVKLTEEDQEKAKVIAKQLDIRDSNAVLGFGVEAQSRNDSQSRQLLQAVRIRDAGDAGEVLSTLMQNVKDVNADAFANRATSSVARVPVVGKMYTSVDRLIGSYESVAEKIDRLVAELVRQGGILQKDIARLDVLFEKNTEDFRQLQLYIAAGDIAMQNATAQLEEMRSKAEQADGEVEPQEVADFAAAVERLERRVHDLRLAEMNSRQKAPQIRMVQDSGQSLVEMIQTSILTTIPAWTDQIIIAIGLYNQRKALELQRAVTNTTNELLLKNAEMLHQGVTGVQRESQRGVIEIETLKTVNDKLIQTIQEALQIQAEGHQKRIAAEAQLVEMTNQLGSALLTARDQSAALRA